MNRKLSLLLFICILSYFVVIGCFVMLPQEPIVGFVALVFSLILTSAIILLNKETFSVFYGSRYFKSLCEKLVSVFLVFCILSLINYLAFKNPLMMDVSKRKNNSLTQVSKNILRKLEQSEGTMTIHVVSLKKNFVVIKHLTELYRIESSRVNVNFIDAEVRPDLVKELNVTKIPSLVLEYQIENKKKRKVINSLREDQLTTQMNNLMRGREITFYFTQGHGEIDLRSSDNEGGSAWLELMSKNGFVVKNVRMQNLKEIPKDMDVLVLWGAKSSYFQNDLEFLDKYLSAEGSILLALNPFLNKEDTLSNLRLWLKEKGLNVANNLVVDKKVHVNGSKGTIPYVHLYNRDHPLTREASTDTFFPLVSGMEVVQDSTYMNSWQLLAWSSDFPEAWGASNISKVESLELEFNEKNDMKGPLAYLAAYEKDQSKMLVFSNSSFVINTYKKFTQNLALALAAMNWIGGDSETLSFDMPQLKDRPMFIGDNQKGVIFYFSVLFLPLFLFIISFFLYRRRQA